MNLKNLVFKRLIKEVIFACVTISCAIGLLRADDVPDANSGDAVVYASKFRHGSDDSVFCGWMGRQGLGDGIPEVNVVTVDEDKTTYGVTVHTTGNLGCGLLLNRTVPTIKGDIYTLKFWVKISDADLFTFHVTDETESTGWQSIPQPSTPGDWVEINYSFVAQSDHIGLEIGDNGQQAPTNLTVKDVTITHKK